MRACLGLAFLALLFFCDTGQCTKSQNTPFLHYGHCRAESTLLNAGIYATNDCFNPTNNSTEVAIREKRETRDDLNYVTVNFQNASSYQQLLTDIQVLKRSSGNSLYLCARVGKSLVGLELNTETRELKEHWRSQVFTNIDTPYPGKYPWFLSDIQKDGNDLIMIRTDETLKFLKPNQQFSSLVEITNDDYYGDFYNWNADDQVVLLGNFYPDKSYTGLFSKKPRVGQEDEFRFLSVNSELGPNSDTFLELSKVTLDEFWNSSSTKFSLQAVKTDDRSTFVLHNENEMRFYEFYEKDDDYIMNLTLKTSLVLSSSEYGRATIKFGNFTNQEHKDMLILNDLGLFLYQYNTTNNNFTILDADTSFSRRNGWHDDLTSTLDVVTLSQGDLLTFSGPSGFSVMEFDFENTTWTPVLDTKTRQYPVAVSPIKGQPNDVIFIQTNMGDLQWGPLEPSSKVHEPLIPKDVVDYVEDDIDFFNIGNARRSQKIKQIPRKPLPLKPILRWSERWPDNFAKEAINAANGNVEFILPLVNITLSTNLYVDVSVYYDSLRDKSTLLGRGWATNLMQDYILVNYQQSIYPSDFKYYINRRGVVHDLTQVPGKIENNEITFRIGNSTEMVVFHRSIDSWTYVSGSLTKTYGICGNKDAIHWSLGWKLTHGLATEVDSLEPLPAAWYLCQVEDTAWNNALIYHYEKDWATIHGDESGKKRIVTNLRISTIEDKKGLAIKFSYQPKAANEYKVYDPYDYVNNLYSFPTQLSEKYLLTEIKTETQLHSQNLKLNFRKVMDKSIFSSMHQVDGAIREDLVRFEYEEAAKSVVITKYIAQNNLSVSFEYESLADPDLYPDVKKFPLYSDQQMSVSNNYIVKAHKHFLNNKELVIDIMNNMATHTIDKVTAKAENPITSFDVRALNNHIIALLFTDEATQVSKFYKVNDSWSHDAESDFVSRNSTISVYEGVIIYAEKDQTRILEWDEKSLRWKEGTLDVPPLSRTIIESNRILGYSGNKIYLINKNLDNGKWETINIDLGNWEFKECEIMKRFNFTQDVNDEICDMIKIRGFQMAKNIIFLSNVVEEDNHDLVYMGLLLIIDKNYNIAQRTEIQLYKQNLYDMATSSDIEIDGTKGTVHFKHKEDSGKIVIDVDKVTGPLDDKLTVRQMKELMKTLREENEGNLTTSALVQWGNYSSILGPQGVYLGDATMYRMTGSAWKKMNVTNQDYAELGDNLILQSGDDKKFKIQPQGKSKPLKTIHEFELSRPGQMINRYPEYIAYQPNNFTVKLIMFQDKDTLGNIITLHNENLIFASGYNTIMTIANNSKDSTEFVTLQALKVRPVSSLQRKNFRPAAKAMKTSDGVYDRLTGYQRKFKTNKEDLKLTQIVELIPANDTSVAGYMEQEVTFDMLHKTSSSKSKAYNNENEEVPIPPRKNQTQTPGNYHPGLDEMLWDSSGEWLISNFNPYNMTADEADYHGFEAYEMKRKWNYKDEDVERGGFSFTGQSFLRLSGKSIQRTFIPTFQDGIYIASCWIRAPTVLPLGKPSSILSARINNSNGTDLIKLFGETKRTFGEWSYLEIRIDFRLLTEVYRSYIESNYDLVKTLTPVGLVKFQIILTVAAQENTVVDVDHVRFSPLAHKLLVNVYDPTLLQVTSNILHNGLTTRMLYNQFGQRITTVDETNKALEVLGGSYTGRLLKNSDLNIEIQPYSEITINGQTGFVENFDGIFSVKRWRVSDAQAWNVAPYQIWHNTNSWHYIEAMPKLMNPETNAIRLEYSLYADEAALKFSWGDSLFAFTRQNDGMVFTPGTNTKESTSLLPLSGELILFRDPMRVAIFLDGVLLHDKSLTFKDQPWTSFSIHAFGQTVLQNIIIQRNPSVEIKYHNAWSDVTQVLSLQDVNRVKVTETLYDQLGRGSITIKSTEVAPKLGDPIFAYYKDFVENKEYMSEESVWKTGKLKGLANELNADDQGFAYYRTVFFNNPLNQKSESGMPGADYSVKGKFKKSFKMDSDIDFMDNLFPIGNGYRQETVVEPNESIHVEIYDNKNNKVAKYVQVPGYDHLLTTYEYDEQKRLVKILPPLYHTLANTSSKTSVYVPGEETLSHEEKQLQSEVGTFFVFDTEGNLVKRKTPDQGEVEFIYTGGGNIRFMFTMNATNNLTESVTYYEYDARGEMTETGEITTPLSRDQLLSYKNKIYIPGKKEHQEIQYFDSHPDPTLRGRTQLITTHTSNGTVLDQVIYNEDDLVTKKSTIPVSEWLHFGAITNLNKTFIGKRVHRLEYPLLIEGVPLNLLHEYNSAGQLIKMGMPGKSDLFASFSYYGSGLLEKERYNIDGGYTRKYTYDSPGYILGITDRFLEQRTTYMAGGYGQEGFGEGMIMSTRNQAAWKENANEAKFLIKEDKLPNSTYSKMCYAFLKEKGYLTAKGKPLKTFIPNAVSDLPILCSGGLAYSFAEMIAAAQPSLTSGHCFSYGNHQELVKAKYFSNPEESCANPLQPITFHRDISGLSSEESFAIFQILESNHFITSDSNRNNASFTIGTSGNPLIKSGEIKLLLNEMSKTDRRASSYQFALEKLIKIKLIEKTYFNKAEFKDIAMSWDRSPSSTPSDTSFYEKLYNALEKNKLIPTQQNPIQCLDEKFVKVLEKWEQLLPNISSVLQYHFLYSLGSSPFDVMSFEIDSNGNHRQFKVGFSHYTLEYSKNSNRIENVQRTSILIDNFVTNYTMRHDSKGNVIQALHKGILDVSYHPVSQLTTAITMETRRIFFFYDARGERILKQVVNNAGNVTHETYYLRDDKGKVLMDRRVNYNPNPIAPDVITTAYIYGPRGLLGFVRNDKFYSVTTDHIGSTKLVIHKGEVVAAYDYLPYGQLVKKYGDDPNAHIVYRYTGQEYDEETDLYNYHARLYDPSIGRFYQPDPQSQYPSPYKYAGNSPVSLFDPDGEFVLITTAIILGITAAFLAGAAYNGTWNPAKWKWNAGTIVAIFSGFVTGFLLPFAAVGSVAFLTTIGTSSLIGLSFTAATFAAISFTAVLGVGGAYLITAAAHGADPTQWKWKDPAVWNDLFSGFATGAGILGAFEGIHSLGNKVFEQARNAAMLGIKKFARAISRVAIGSGYLAGAAGAYYSMTKANGNNPAFWEWDTGFKTWTALIDGFDMGAGIPGSLHALGGGIKDLYKLIFKSSGDSWPKFLSVAFVKKLAATLMNHKDKLFQVALGSVYAYIGGLEANERFTNWDWANFGTYKKIGQGFLKGRSLVTAYTESQETEAKATRKKLKVTITSAARKVALSSKNAINKALRSAYKGMGRGLHLTRQGLEILSRFASNIATRQDNFWTVPKTSNSFSPAEIGNRRGRIERDAFGDIELISMNRINDDTQQQIRSENRVVLENNVNFMTCTTHLRRRRRDLNSFTACSPRTFTPPRNTENAEMYLQKTKNREMLQAMIDKTPRTSSTIFYPEYILGGVTTHLQTGSDNVQSAHVLRLTEKKQDDTDVVDQTIIAIHNPKIDGTVEVNLKKVIVDQNDTTEHKNRWSSKKMINPKKLKELLAQSGVNDTSIVDIKAELLTLKHTSQLLSDFKENSKVNEVIDRQSSEMAEKKLGSAAAAGAVPEYQIDYTDGVENLKFSDLVDNAVNVDFVNIFKQDPDKSILIEDEITPKIFEFIENNEDPGNYEKQKELAHEIAMAFLDMYQDRLAIAGQTPSEAEFQAFMYGAMEMNFKSRYGVDIVTRGGPKELDMLVYFRKDSHGIDNWNSVPIIFQLKSGLKPEEPSKDSKTFDSFFPGINVKYLPSEVSPDTIEARYCGDANEIQTAKENVSRKGYFFNLPVRSFSDKGIVVGIDSTKGQVQSELFNVPKYEGLVDVLIEHTNDPEKVFEQVLKQYYSFSPFGQQASLRSMSRITFGEAMSRAKESYVYPAKSSSDPSILLFKNNKAEWILLQIIDGSSKALNSLTLPKGVPVEKVKQFTITVKGDLLKDGAIEMKTSENIKLEKENGEKSLLKIMTKIDMSMFIHTDEGNSPMEAVLASVQAKLKSVNVILESETEGKALVLGLFVGSQKTFESEGKLLRVVPESSLSPTGLVDLIVSVTDDTSAISREEYINVIKINFTNKKENTAEMQDAIEQTKTYFEQHNLDTFTNRDLAESVAVVFTDNGDVKYTILDVTLGKKPDIKPSFTTKKTNADTLGNLPKVRNDRSIRQETEFKHPEVRELKLPAEKISSLAARGKHGVSEAKSYQRRRILEYFSTSSASRTEFWPIYFIKSIFSTLTIIWKTSEQVMPKRVINKMSQGPTFQSKMSGQYFSILDMGDQWLAETNFQGNMLWLMIIVKKFTGISPLMDRQDNRQYDRYLDILASEVTYDFADNLITKGTACGITPVVRKLMHEVDFAKTSSAIYKKLAAREIDGIGEILFREFILSNKTKIAKLTTEKQANKLVDLVLNNK